MACGADVCVGCEGTGQTRCETAAMSGGPGALTVCGGKAAGGGAKRMEAAARLVGVGEGWMDAAAGTGAIRTGAAAVSESG